MPSPTPIALAELAPGGLVAPGSHDSACSALAEALLAAGHAVINLPGQQPEPAAASRALTDFWDRCGQDKQGLRPAQLRDGVGYRELTDERELLDYRVGPWLRDEPPLPELAAVANDKGAVCSMVFHPGFAAYKATQVVLQQASAVLDPIARSLLAALCRSAFVRLPGSALAPVLDDLPLPPHAWTSSSLQCFRYRAGSGGCEGHEDRALLTLIYAPGQPGLQVQDAVGQWHDIELGAKQLLLMAGHALEHATCGLIRAGRHRVTLGGAERCSLAYKLAAQPSATLNLVPALQAAGHDLGAAVNRYPQPITYQQIMARFEATHRTANPPAQPAGVGGTAAAGFAATAGSVAAATGPAGGSAGGGQRHPAKRAHGEAPPVIVKEEPGEEAFNIVVMNQDSERLTFQVTRRMLWRRVADAYCAEAGVDFGQTRFVMDLERLEYDYTIEQLGIEEGDVVMAFQQQIGD